VIIIIKILVIIGIADLISLFILNKNNEIKNFDSFDFLYYLLFRYALLITNLFVNIIFSNSDKGFKINLKNYYYLIPNIFSFCMLIIYYFVLKNDTFGEISEFGLLILTSIMSIYLVIYTITNSFYEINIKKNRRVHIRNNPI
jgi:hypothetical protein